MPTVPKFDEPRVQQTALPGVRIQGGATEANFGLGSSFERTQEIGQQVLSAADKLAKTAKKQADDLMVLEKEQQTAALETDYLYNPKTGAMNRRGKDSFGLPDEAREVFKKHHEETEKSLSNDEQKATYRKYAMARFSDVDRKINVHVSGEMYKHDEAVTSSFLETEQNAAAANYKDEARIKLSLDRQTFEYMKHADRNGLAKEVVEEKVASLTSSTHTAVLNRMLAKDQDLAAKSYFGKHKDSIVGKDALSMEKALEEGSLRGESQRIGDRVMDSGKDLSEGLKQVKDLTQGNPKLRQETEQRVKQLHHDRTAAIESTQKEVFREISNIVENSGGRDKGPPALWDKIELSQRNAIDARSEQLRKGIEPVTDQSEWYNLMNLASAPETKSDFLRTDLVKYRHVLSNGDFQEMTKLQVKLRADGGSKELDGFRTDSMIVNDSLTAAGIDATSPKQGTEDAQKVAIFRRKVDEEIRTYQDRSSKKVTNEDVQRIVDGLIIKGKDPKSGIFGFFKSDKSAFEVENIEEIEISVDSLPKGERKEIEMELRKRKLPVTDDRIVRIYKMSLQKRKK